METHSIWSYIKHMLRSFFIGTNAMQPKLQLLAQIMQNIIYITMLNGVQYYQIQRRFKEGSVVFMLLIILYLTKYFFKISLGLWLYLIVIQNIVQNNSVYVYVNFVMVGILVIADVIGSISFDFSRQVVQSESRNLNKVYKSVILMTNIILFSVISTQIYINITSFVFFILLFIYQHKSLIKNGHYRQITLRFYLCASFEHLRLFLNGFFQANSLYFTIGGLVLSQIIFSVYNNYTLKVNLHELLAKEDYLELSFYVLRNKVSTNYSESTEKFAKSLLNQEQLELHLHPEQNIDQIILTQLSKSNNFLENILKVEIHITNGHLFVAKEILTIAKERVKWYHFVDRILVYRMDQYIANKYEKNSGQIITAYKQEYEDFLQFQELLHKTAMQNLKFNLYLRKNEIELMTVKEMCSKLVRYEVQVDEAYERIKDCFVASTDLYVAYLLKVKNDFHSADQILNKQIIKEKSMAGFSLDEKVFLRLKLQETGLLIDRVGYNVKQLLDFSRKDLEGQKLERLVPSFFRKQHESLTTAFAHDQFERMFLFQKAIVVLNNRNTYSQCSVMIRLSYAIGEDFCFEGHLHVTQAEQHDLDSFLFVNEKGAIVECSDNLLDLDLDSDRNALRVDQYFDTFQVGLPLKKLTDNGVQVYQPLMVYIGLESFYFYFKKIGPPLQKPLQQNNQLTSKQANAGSKMISEFKMPNPQNFAQIEDKIKNKQIMLLSLITIIFIGCLFGSEYLLIYSAQVKYNNQKWTVQNCRVLMQYYNYSLKLQLNMVYIDLRDNYNYSNTFSLLQLSRTALQMQSLNQYMKKYVIGPYKLPTYNSQLSYSQNNYELYQTLTTYVLLYDIFKNDSFLKNMVLDNVKLVAPVIGLQSITDYRISLQNIMTTFVQNDIYYQKLSFALSLANILIFILFAIRIFCKLRAVEQIALEYRCLESRYQKKVDHILNFLKEITLEEIPIHTINREIHVYDGIVKTETDSLFLKSEMSLIKEPTGRSLMNDTLNKTGFIEEINKDQRLKTQSMGMNYVFKKGKSHRFILIIFGSFIIVLLSLTICNEVFNYIMRDVNEVTSLNSVVAIYRTNGYYGTRGIINTFNTILLKNQKNVDYGKNYYPVITGFYTFMATLALPTFPEASLPEFSTYAINLKKLYYDEICTYMVCDPVYYEQLNLNFVTVIKKLSANLSNLVTQTSNMTQPQLTAYFNAPANKHYIDLLFYSQNILRNYITNMIMLYLDNYAQFMTNLYGSKLNYISSMIAFTILGMFVFLYFMKYTKDEQDLFIKILKIYN